MSEPLSDEELEAMRRRNMEGILLSESGQNRRTYSDRARLLAEIYRLRAEVAAMRPIVEAVANASQPFGAQPGSGIEILYTRSGTQDNARAALGSDAPDVLE